MTDNEIIKALECCVLNKHICPHTCPMLKSKDCLESLRKYALDLITRQQAEIEALIAGQETLQKYIAQQQARIDEFMKETAVTTLIDDAIVYTPTLEDYNKFKKKFKSEAVKEFAERVKEKYGIAECIVTVDSADIDNLVKEMVGENNE